jgi:AraC-like DNA-binding protein
MDRARQMLASQRTVTEVCFEVGDGSLASFSSKFRAQFSRGPAEFQREMRRIFGYSAPWRVLMVPACFLRVAGLSGHSSLDEREA